MDSSVRGCAANFMSKIIEQLRIENDALQTRINSGDQVSSGDQVNSGDQGRGKRPRLT
ncbi:MAG: hypothetical protein VW378_03300 [bacterium]